MPGCSMQVLYSVMVQGNVYKLKLKYYEKEKVC